MSMYDSVIVKGYKLSQPPELKKFLKENNAEFPSNFQTKDLISCLNIYKIDNKGQVFETQFVKTGKKRKREFPRFGVNRLSLLEKIYHNISSRKYNKYFGNKPWMIDELKEKLVKSTITQTFNIYSYDYTGTSKRLLELEYNIVTINGKVKSTKLINFKLESEKDANKRLKEQEKLDKVMEEQSKKRQEFVNSWYYPVLRETVNPICFFSRKTVQFVCNKLISLSHRWTGV